MARKKVKMSLNRAVEILERCDPCDINFDCEECPIGKDIVFAEHDAGVKVTSSVCSLLQIIKENVEDGD